MKQLILNIPENKFRFFMELIKSLGYVGVKEQKSLSKKEKEFIGDLKKSMKEVDLRLRKKIKLKPAKEALNEL